MKNIQINYSQLMFLYAYLRLINPKWGGGNPYSSYWWYGKFWKNYSGRTYANGYKKFEPKIC